MRHPNQARPATPSDCVRDNAAMKTLILMLAVVALAACRQEGPAEKAGRQLDQAGKDVARSVDRAADNLRGKK